MKPYEQLLRIKSDERYTTTIWQRVAHLRKVNNDRTYCNEQAYMDLSRSYLVAGVYNLCNHCFAHMKMLKADRDSYGKEQITFD